MIGVNDWLARSTSLLPALRDAGLQSAIGEQLKILQLLQLLEERGAAPKTPEELARWVAPVLCTRSDQVPRLLTILTQHFGAISLPQNRTPTSIAALSPRSGLAWIWILAVILMLTALLVGFFRLVPTLALQVAPIVRDILKPSVVPYDFSQREVITIAIVLAIGTGTIGWLIYRRIRLALRSGQPVGPGKSHSVALDPPLSDTDNPELLRAARVLNRPSLKATGHLDVSATVRATAQAGGRFLPIKSFRRLAANWLLLVERNSAQDPLPAFGARLSALLDRSGVRHSLYEFRRSPAWVREGGPRGPHGTLERALGKVRPTRLLIFSEAARTIDSHSGSPARWLIDNDVPQEVILLTPKARDLWSNPEAQAAHAGILVLPADPSGISTLARRIQAEELKPELFVPVRESQFDVWQEERFIWLSRTKPASDVRRNLIDTLKQLLTVDEFRLLVGVAAFPKVHVELMSTLDRSLYPSSEPGAQRSRLLKLGRLVWIKEGFIPEWLREELLRALRTTDVRVLRDTWTALLDRKPQPSDKRTILKIHSEGGVGIGVTADELFIGFLQGEFDLPAPLRLAGLSAFMRGPDRTDWILTGTGVALVALFLVAGVNVLEWLQTALQHWADFVRMTRDRLPPFFSPEFCRQLTMAPLVLGVGWLAAIALGRTSSLSLSRLFAAVGAAITVSFGWLGADRRGLFALATSDLLVAFFAPLIISVAVVLLFTARERPVEVDIDLHTIVQRTRGAGLRDWPTNLVLVFTGSLAVLTWDAQASLWIAVIPTLGIARAILISASGAQLQRPISLDRTLIGRAMIGLVFGQVVAVAVFSYFQLGLSPLKNFATGSPFLAYRPYLSFGPLFLGGLFGLLIALWQHKLLPMRTVLSYVAAITPVALWIPIVAYYFVIWFVLDPTRNDPLLASRVVSGLQQSASFRSGSYFAVWAATSLVAVALVGRALAQYRPSGSALHLSSLFATIGAGAIVLVARALHYLDDSFVFLYSIMSLAVIWPLIQRIFSSEPSILDQSSGWRARAIAPRLWATAPLVFVTALSIPVGPFQLDLISLILPLAIWLGWQFGLRGWRTVLLMVLPAFWPIAPEWASPPTLDMALTALVAAALFARPRLFAQTLSISSLPSAAALAVAAALSFQVHLSSNSLELATDPLSEQSPNSSDIKGGVQSSTTNISLFAPAYSVAIEWTPGAFAVLTFFLIGLSSLGKQGAVVVISVLLAGSAVSFPEAFPIGPVSAISAAAGLFAYGLGQFLRWFLASERSSLTSVRSTAMDWIAPCVLLLFAIGVAVSSLSSRLPQWDGSSSSLLALAALLSWTAAVRLGKRETVFRTGLACLLMLGMLLPLGWLIHFRLPAFLDSIQLVLGPFDRPPPIFALFLPAIFFGLGRQCRDSILQSAEVLPIIAKTSEPASSGDDEVIHSEATPVEPRVSWRKSAAPAEIAATEAIGSRKRIVILIDGPGMGYGENVSNVLKMYRCLQGELDSSHQTVLYVSGAGSGSVSADLDPWRKLRNDILGVVALATGYSFDDDVLTAYEFLVKNYQEGDEIYLFGFGRGAYAARATAGFVHKIGLISQQQLSFARAGLTAYKRASRGEQMPAGIDDEATRFAGAFSVKRPTIKFVGIWDTVAPAILPRPDRLYLPSLEQLAFTMKNPGVRMFRQAISIDERRVMFRLTPWVEPQTFIGSSVDGVPTEQDSVQVWFAGVHADVGGGYPEHQSGLSKYPLIWMVEEAVKSGLTINPATFQELAWGISVRANTSATNVLPNFSAPMHNSLFGFWRLLEFLPKSARYKEWPGRRSFLGFYIPAGEPRLIPEGAIIHESVIRRMEAIADYRPVNLPRQYQIESMPERMATDVSTVRS